MSDICAENGRAFMLRRHWVCAFWEDFPFRGSRGGAGNAQSQWQFSKPAILFKDYRLNLFQTLKLFIFRENHKQ